MRIRLQRRTYLLCFPSMQRDKRAKALRPTPARIGNTKGGCTRWAVGGPRCRELGRSRCSRPRSAGPCAASSRASTARRRRRRPPPSPPRRALLRRRRGRCLPSSRPRDEEGSLERLGARLVQASVCWSGLVRAVARVWWVVCAVLLPVQASRAARVTGLCCCETARRPCAFRDEGVVHRSLILILSVSALCGEMRSSCCRARPMPSADAGCWRRGPVVHLPWWRKP